MRKNVGRSADQNHTLFLCTAPHSYCGLWKKHIFIVTFLLPQLEVYFRNQWRIQVKRLGEGVN